LKLRRERLHLIGLHFELLLLLLLRLKLRRERLHLIGLHFQLMLSVLPLKLRRERLNLSGVHFQLMLSVLPLKLLAQFIPVETTVLELTVMSNFDLEEFDQTFHKVTGIMGDAPGSSANRYEAFLEPVDNGFDFGAASEGGSVGSVDTGIMGDAAGSFLELEGGSVGCVGSVDTGIMGGAAGSFLEVEDGPVGCVGSVDSVGTVDTGIMGGAAGSSANWYDGAFLEVVDTAAEGGSVGSVDPGFSGAAPQGGTITGYFGAAPQGGTFTVDPGFSGAAPQGGTITAATGYFGAANMGGTSETSSKRYRTVFSSNQTEVMTLFFQGNQKPSMVQCDRLGAEIKLDKHVVHTWFKNRRAEQKKLQKLQQMTVHEPESPGYTLSQVTNTSVSLFKMSPRRKMRKTLAAVMDLGGIHAVSYHHPV
jgi:hypothetical protein